MMVCALGCDAKMATQSGILVLEFAPRDRPRAQCFKIEHANLMRGLYALQHDTNVTAVKSETSSKGLRTLQQFT